MATTISDQSDEYTLKTTYGVVHKLRSHFRLLFDPLPLSSNYLFPLLLTQ